MSMSTVKSFSQYCDTLAALPGVNNTRDESSKSITSNFTSKNKNAMSVTVSLVKARAEMSEFLMVQIVGINCDFWNTVEHQDLDFFIDLASDALLGKVVNHRTPIFRRKEVCFKVEGGWACVPVSKSFRSITHRKKLFR